MFALFSKTKIEPRFVCCHSDFGPVRFFHIPFDWAWHCGKFHYFCKMGMRNATVLFLTLVALVFFSTSLRAQNLTLNYFHASPDGSDVIVAFEVPSEAGVTDFKLWRKVGSETNYAFLESISPNGVRAYQFHDYTIFKDEAKTISYKLQIFQNV